MNPDSPFRILFTASDVDGFPEPMKAMHDYGAEICGTTNSLVSLQALQGIKGFPLESFDGMPDRIGDMRSIGEVKVGAVRTHIFMGIKVPRSNAELLKHIGAEYGAMKIDMVVMRPYPVHSDAFSPGQIDIAMSLLDACIQQSNAIPIIEPRDLWKVREEMAQSSNGWTITSRLQNELNLKAAEFIHVQRIKIVTAMRRQMGYKCADVDVG